jgi:putative glutamine amidotransferase
VSILPTVSTPVIGITAIPRTVHSAFGPYPGQTLGDAFIRAVEAAGGVAVMLPSTEPSAAAVQVSLIDGLILSGGSDIHPQHYDGDHHDRMTWVDQHRDRWELAVLDAAAGRSLPVLGVCRGAQLLNVWRGGSLHPHLEGDDPVHEGGAETRHPIAVEAGSLLGSLVPDGAQVTSLHHQGIDRLGRGLAVSARAPDGLAEAVEDPSCDVLGVAWHPEVQLTEAAGQPLVAWLVDRARARSTYHRGVS